MECSNNFIQSAVKTRTERDEKPSSTVVAETMKLLSNSSYVYQIMNRSRYKVTRYLKKGKTHGDISNEMFMCPG